MTKINTKQNLHTHTTYVDGKDTPEELVLEAIERGFGSIGFSEHSYMKFSPNPNQLTPEKMEAYRKDVGELKRKYSDKLGIYCGLEYDFYSDVNTDGFDYLIGSVHYLDCFGKRLTFDKNLEAALSYVRDYFSGDGMKFAKEYFETVCRLGDKKKIDIIGHFDLITKNNELGKFIDVDSSEYLGFGYEAIRALRGKIPFFEVNTGAIARGYRTAPYPKTEFLKEFRRLGFGAIISSDCHNKSYLDCYFDNARELLLAAGFKSKWILSDSGFAEVEL